MLESEDRWGPALFQRWELEGIAAAESIYRQLEA
jgi:hypothetical protein